MNDRQVALRYEIRAEAGSDQAEVMLYGEIVEGGPKYRADDKSAAEFHRQIMAVRDKGAKRLKLKINSPGGIVSEAVAMRATLADAGFDEITVRIEGLCASAATIPATLAGARVEIAEGSDYMIHNPWSFAVGEAKDLEKSAERLHQVEDKIRRMYVDRSGQSEEQVKAWMDEETWFSAEDAVKYGFADEVFKPKKAEEPVMACAAMMKAMYRHTPQRLLAAAHEDVSDGETPAEIDHHRHEEEAKGMEWNDVTQEQLRDNRPELFDAICAEGARMERERLNEIDELTPAGYEDMAAQAKANGDSAMAFYKSVIRAQKEKAQNYLESRRKETDAAKNVGGGSTEEGNTAEDEVKAFAREMAGYVGGNHATGMY